LSTEAMILASSLARAADLEQGIAYDYSAPRIAELAGNPPVVDLNDAVRELERNGLLRVLRVGHGPDEPDFAAVEPKYLLFYKFASDVQGELNPEDDPTAAASLISELGEATEQDFAGRLGWSTGRANLAVACLASCDAAMDANGGAPFGFYKALANPKTRLFAKGLLQ